MPHATPRWRSIKKGLAWSFWGANLLVILWFWLSGPAAMELASGDPILVLYALARLAGLTATFCALTQFVLMGRAGWLEPIFGLDRLAIFHRRNGIATITLILAHVALMIIVQAALRDTGIISGFVATLSLPYVLLAAAGAVLFVMTVTLSLLVIRRHLKFETWYAVHLFNYAAIALVPLHQFTIGTDLVVNEVFRYYWLGIYVFAALNLLVWRFGKVFWLYFRHRFRVEKVVPETPTATSVYITGRNMEQFRAKGGQFVLVRFFDKRVVWQEHPFSLSRLPGGNIRLTIRQLGDFTNLVPSFKPGTPVWVSGPFGAFTHELQVKDKVLYIAGGIGITPIRAMLEDRVSKGLKGTAVMLYGNRTQADAALWDEVSGLARRLSMPLHSVLSEQQDSAGETGYVDKEKIARLVPDVTRRDVFLCGPPPMMAGVKKALKELGVPDRQVHYERFALHKQ